MLLDEVRHVDMSEARPFLHDAVTMRNLPRPRTPKHEYDGRSRRRYLLVPTNPTVPHPVIIVQLGRPHTTARAIRTLTRNKPPVGVQQVGSYC